MRINSLLKGINYTIVQGSEEKEVSGISWDSRRVKPGSVFICVKGNNVDRHSFAAQAVKDGASALIVDHEVYRIPNDITIIKVKDTRIALGTAAAAIYDYPSEAFKLIGVTGTNGKTSVTWFIERILQYCGKTPGIISTIENRIGIQKLDTVKINPTTPDNLELQQCFRELADKGASHVIMEVTSSALAQNRVYGCNFDLAIFTNLTQDHLEEHGTMENYKNEKLKLFKMCRFAVINRDDFYSQEFINGAECPVLTYGINNESSLTAKDIEYSISGTNFILLYENKSYPIHINVAGKFNVYNVLAAIGACLQYGLSIDNAAAAIESIEFVKGRYEYIKNSRGISVIVDYAHSPHSLENILASVKEFTEKRVIVVFGCGGDRDKIKRPIMGKIAGNIADYCIITSDNPRKENPLNIIEEIEKGIAATRCKYEKLQDRKKAIITALSMAKRGDSVVIAGKGHESYQIIGEKYMYFDDGETVREYFEDKTRWDNSKDS